MVLYVNYASIAFLCECMYLSKTMYVFGIWFFFDRYLYMYILKYIKHNCCGDTLIQYRIKTNNFKF